MTNERRLGFGGAWCSGGTLLGGALVLAGVALAGVVLTGVVALSGPAAAAEPAYPFEGSWVRVNRVCTASSPHVRIYTAHEVTSRTGHCSFRKVASGSGQFEIFEDCRRSEQPGYYTESIRMFGPDAMQVRRQAGRLKIARGFRYLRCNLAGPAGKPPSSPPPRKPASPVPDAQARPAEPPKP